MATATLTNGNGRATHSPEAELVDLDHLDETVGTQMRPGLDEGHVETLEGLLRDGKAIDPIDLTRTDDGRDIPTDGWHRIEAHRRAGFLQIYATVTPGTDDDAIERAARANDRPTLPRCEETKRNTVLALMGLPAYRDLSIRQIADAASVPLTFANAVWAADQARKSREAEAAGSTYTPPATLRGSDGKRYKAPAVPRTASVDSPINSTPAPSGQLIPQSTESPADDSRAGDDEEFLAGLYRDTGKEPVRDRLTPENRRRFDAEALLYRDFCQAASWVAERKRFNGLSGERKVGANDGPMVRKLSGAFRILNPKDWSLCYVCKGTGVAEGHRCSGCVDGCGYTTK